MKFAYCGLDSGSGVFRTVIEHGHSLLKIFSAPVDNRFSFNQQLSEVAKSAEVDFQTSEMTADDIERLADSGCEMLVSMHYKYKIPANWEKHFKYCVNCHPSLLPEGKGPNPLCSGLLKGFKTTGTTLHKVSDKWDSGDIILQEAYPISVSDDIHSLSARHQISALKLMNAFLADPETHWNNAVPQEPGSGSYWKAPSEEDRTLDWSTSVDELSRIVRTFGKYGSYAYMHNFKVVLKGASFHKCEHDYAPGTIINSSHLEVIIAAPDGLVAICLSDIEPLSVKSG